MTAMSSQFTHAYKESHKSKQNLRFWIIIIHYMDNKLFGKLCNSFLYEPLENFNFETQLPSHFDQKLIKITFLL